MNFAFVSTLSLLAQAGDAAPPAANPLVQAFPLIIFGVLFYVLLIRPQMRKQKEQKNLLGGLKTGDTVVMIGGEHGIITNVQDSTVTVKVADNVKIRYQKTAVDQVLKSTEAPAAAEAAS